MPYPSLFANRNASVRGNTLFLILLGVALFAALSYAVVMGGSGLTKSSTITTARLTAAEMLQYGQNVRLILEKMLTVNGISDTTATLFAATGANAAYGVPGTAPASEVFHARGGGVAYILPPPAGCSTACAYEFTGQISITGVGSNPALAMVVRNVDPEVCQQINSIMATGWASIPAGDALALTRFAGAYGGGSAITLAGVMTGKQTFCYQDAGDVYILVQTLRSR